MTILHAGGKFDHSSYKVSAGLHGVGVSAVNAVSEWLKLEIRRDGKVHLQEYRRGAPVTPIKPSEHRQTTGTKVTFKPDPTIFTITGVQLRHPREPPPRASFLNAGFIITLTDERARCEPPRRRSSSTRAASASSSST